MKKTIAILLSICLSVIAFAGCSLPNPDDKGEGTPSDSSPTVQAGTTASNPTDPAPSESGDAPTDSNDPTEPTDHAHAYGEDQLCEICGWAYPENLYYFRFVGSGDGYYILASYYGDEENVIIPQKYNGKPIQGIGDRAFEDRSNLLSIEIPDSVTSLGYRAFGGCTSLVSVTVPGTMVSIYTTAFENCTGLKSVVFEDGVRSIDGFMGCTALESVTVPDSVTSIGSNAFQNCSSLSSIHIPDGVTSVGAKAFDGCSKLIETENGISYVENWAILCDQAVTDAVLRDGTVGIATATFYECTSLKSITIPVSMKTIPMYAVRSCPSLTTVNYCGTEAQWDEISISSYNDELLAANVVYHS